MIPADVRTWHENFAVVVCANICIYLFDIFWITAVGIGHQIWIDCAVRQQSISCDKEKPDPCRHMAPLGHNELKPSRGRQRPESYTIKTMTANVVVTQRTRASPGGVLLWHTSLSALDVLRSKEKGLLSREISHNRHAPASLVWKRKTLFGHRLGTGHYCNRFERIPLPPLANTVIRPGNTAMKGE